MFSHLAIAASPGLTIVWSCHSIKKRVTILILALAIVCINSGNSLGGKLGILVTCGVLNAALIPANALWSSKPVLTACVIISFRYPIILLVNSKLPLAANGLSIGLWPNAGKIWFSRLRQRLMEVVSAILVFLISNQFEAINKNVLLALNLSSTCWSFLCSLGSIPLVISSFDCARFLRASASDNDG